MNKPILYTFRRCPYAIRARSILIYCKIDFEKREVSLKNKPAEMLQVSPKGTVPVLVLPNGDVLEESLDIMHWAMDLTNCGLKPKNAGVVADIETCIKQNDTEFKKNLDAYKYHKPTLPLSRASYRENCELFLITLEERLKKRDYLFDTEMTYGDLAIIPFIRQFSSVEPEWFTQNAYPLLRQWLQAGTQSTLFSDVMKK